MISLSKPSLPVLQLQKRHDLTPAPGGGWRRPLDCVGCPLFELGDSFSALEGSGRLGLGVLAEALGQKEAMDGLPLRPSGDSGAIFEQVLRMSQRPDRPVSRQDLLITNVVRCRPPGNALEGEIYEYEAIRKCQTHLLRAYQQHPLSTWLTLGNIATRELTGFYGPKQGVSLTRGYVLDNTLFSGGYVVPTFHPSYLAHGKRGLLGVLVRDFLLALDIALGRTKIERPTYGFIEFPEREFVERWIREELLPNPHLPIAVDVETEKTQGEDEEDYRLNTHGDAVITQIQFAVREREGTILHWGDWQRDMAIRILSLPNPKVTWNGKGYDYLRFREEGIHPQGIHHDAMDSYRFLYPDLPRGLQFATSFAVVGALPWKHLSHSQPGFYGGLDVSHTLSCHRFQQDLIDKRGARKIFDRHYLQLDQVMLSTSRRGVPMNPAAHAEFLAFTTEQEQLSRQRLQDLVPLDLLQPGQSYKRGLPKDIQLSKTPVGNGYYRDQEGDWWRLLPGTVKVKRMEKCGECLGTGKGVKISVDKKGQTQEKAIKCRVCKGKGGLPAGEELKEEMLWTRMKPFLPSNEQLKRYMAHRGHKIPTLPGEDTETTSKKGLERLFAKTRDRVYGESLEYRAVQKMRGYAEGWRPGPDGAVHAVFTNGPATGQLAAIEPNVLTPPKRGKYAKKFSRMIEARKGAAGAAKTLVCLDFTAFHACTLGYEAKSRSYLLLARNDIHSFVAAHTEGCRREVEKRYGKIEYGMKTLRSGESYRDERGVIVPAGVKMSTTMEHSWLQLPIQELRERLGWVKSNFRDIRDNNAKPAILGIGFGLGAGKLYDLNLEYFQSLEHAKGIIELILGKPRPEQRLRRGGGLFPEIADYQWNVRWEAHKRTFLDTQHHYRRYFWDVYQHRPGGKLDLGGDADKCVAYRPANDAFGKTKEDELWLDERGYLERFGFFLPLHDGLWFEAETRDIEECVEVVGARMGSPSEYLKNELCPSGLRVGWEASIGPNMAEMTPIRKWIPEEGDQGL